MYADTTKLRAFVTYVEVQILCAKNTLLKVKVLIQLLSLNESKNVQPFHLSSTAVAYIVGDIASMPKQNKKIV